MKQSLIARFLAWARSVNWQTEPLLIIAAIRAVVAALAGAGLTVSGHMVAAVVAYITAAGVLLSVVFDRKQVDSPATTATKQAQVDTHLAAASEALALAGPDVQNRARLCPTGPSTTHAPNTQIDRGINYAKDNAMTSFDPTPPPATDTHPVYKLGRHINHDERSKQYGIVPISAEKIVSRRWARRASVFDQGQVGSCTGNAAAGWVGTDDASRQGIATLADGTAVDEKLALAIYSAAETIDGDGPYPPNDNGSSGLSVAKVLKTRGLCTSYLHAFTISAVYTALQTGPGMAGTVWYNSMFNTAADGHIEVDKSSGEAGGHEYLIDELEVAADGTVTKIWMQNSWGTGWGVGGRGYFTPAEFTALLAAQGDFTVPAPAVAPAPTPSPAPTPAPAPAPGPDAGFPAAVAAYSGLADWLAARAEKRGMTPDDYAAWILAGEAHKR